MLEWLFKKWTRESEVEGGRKAALDLLASDCDRDTLSRNYTAAKMDEIYPTRRGPYFAQGYIDVLRPYMKYIRDQKCPNNTPAKPTTLRYTYYD